MQECNAYSRNSKWFWESNYILNIYLLVKSGTATWWATSQHQENGRYSLFSLHFTYIYSLYSFSFGFFIICNVNAYMKISIGKKLERSYYSHEKITFMIKESSEKNMFTFFCMIYGRIEIRLFQEQLSSMNMHSFMILV